MNVEGKPQMVESPFQEPRGLSRCDLGAADNDRGKYCMRACRSVGGWDQYQVNEEPDA